MESTTTIPAYSANSAPVWSAWYGTASSSVIAFFGQLKRIPVEAWHRAAAADPHVTARQCTEDSVLPLGVLTLREALDDQSARARLRDAMETMPGVARRIRQRIDQELAILDGIAPAVTVTRMRRAARLATCAVAARPRLTAEEFARLYRPFEALIPPHKLVGR